MDNFYDGCQLLSQLDLNGKKPELYMSTTNRTAGKTTYFSKLLVNKFFKNYEKFMLVQRYNYELSDIANKFFKDIRGLFFPDSIMESKTMAKGKYCELFLNEKPCGYAVSLNDAEQLKKYSHLFSDTSRMFMDEFQSESNKYCSEEITKFLSLHTTVARGAGKQYRYVPVYMCANTVSLINPYYTALGISNRLRKDTKFLRGDGWVLEQGYNPGAAAAQAESGIMRAFSSSKYVAYASQNVYLNDNDAFIETPKGRSVYTLTLRYEGKDYAIREYTSQGLIYVNDKPDYSFPLKVVVTTEDHNINYVMLQRNAVVLSALRHLFEKGCFRFQDLESKNAALCALSY